MSDARNFFQRPVIVRNILRPDLNLAMEELKEFGFDFNFVLCMPRHRRKPATVVIDFDSVKDAQAFVGRVRGEKFLKKVMKEGQIIDSEFTPEIWLRRFVVGTSCSNSDVRSRR